MAAETAHKAVGAADRTLFADAPAAPARLRLIITTPDLRWRHDGTRLTLDEDQ